MLEKFLKWKRPLSVFVFVLMIVALGKSFFVEPLAHKISPSTINVTEIQWDDCVQLDGHTWDYTYQLPTLISANEVVSIATYWLSVDVYAGEKQLFSFDDTYKDKGSSRQWIAIPQSAAGRVLHVVYKGEKSRAEMSAQEDAYIGNAALVYLTFVLDKAYAVVFAGCVILMLILIAYFNRLMGKHIAAGMKRGLRYLTMFMLLTGVWIICDSQIIFIFSENVAGNTVASFSALLLFPMFLTMFVSEMVEHRVKILDVLAVLYLFVYIFVIGSYLCHTVSLDYSLVSEHILLVVSIVAVIAGGIWDVRTNHNTEMRRILYGFAGLAVCALIALTLFYISPTTGYSIFYCIGLLIFMFFVIWAAYERIYRELGQNANMLAYQKLAYKDVMTDMGNRTAFMQAQETLSKETSVGFVVMDINDLKHTNDVFGHQAGDMMIRSAAECISAVFAGSGSCYRIGGDEFVVILQNTTEEHMILLLENLEEQLLKKQEELNQPWKLKVAYGYAVHRGENSLDELFKQADDSMYECKRRMKEMAAEGSNN